MCHENLSGFSGIDCPQLSTRDHRVDDMRSTACSSSYTRLSYRFLLIFSENESTIGLWLPINVAITHRLFTVPNMWNTVAFNVSLAIYYKLNRQTSPLLKVQELSKQMTQPAPQLKMTSDLTRGYGLLDRIQIQSQDCLGSFC